MTTTKSQNFFPKNEYWQNHFKEWQESGLSKRRYCLDNGLAISTFSYWIRKFRKNSESSPVPAFYPLTVDTALMVSDRPSGLSLHLGE